MTGIDPTLPFPKFLSTVKILFPVVHLAQIQETGERQVLICLLLYPLKE